MKYWQEYYLAKCMKKHFGEINIGNLDECCKFKHDTHTYIIIGGLAKYWWFFNKIVNRQSLLITNISKYIS